MLNNGKMPTEMNDIFITLIPKVSNPTLPKDYRPISFCNVVMKIVTKTIANRLKQFLPVRIMYIVRIVYIREKY